MSTRLFVCGQPIKLAPYLVYNSLDIAGETPVREYEGWIAGYCLGVYCCAAAATESRCGAALTQRLT